jgi:hypothetical protein
VHVAVTARAAVQLYGNKLIAGVAVCQAGCGCRIDGDHVRSFSICSHTTSLSSLARAATVKMANARYVHRDSPISTDAIWAILTRLTNTLEVTVTQDMPAAGTQ